ncbi:MAG TPA: N-acetyl sugar amidotransferase [Candidatus Omnitrophota bacterium]|nr:N-acetyl sugar amidotransferase [Candidatus Omnitrophota bacterium]
MRYCKKCIMPDTRPEQVFDKEGVCDACRSAEKKHKEIDWQKRRNELEQILAQYRNKEGKWWDCIIPVSGGKDSCYQAYTMKYEFGMNPLCVNFVPCEMTEVGLKNILFLRELVFDLVQVAPNRKVFREMVRRGFFDLGDCCWAEHVGLFTVPPRVAVQYKVPLLIWGENSQFEYGGPASKRENNYIDRNWLEQFQMYGYRISDLYEHGGLQNKELLVFDYPSDKELKGAGVTGLFLGYYVKWDSLEHAEMMKKMGWNVNPDGPVEVAYYDFENLDCKWVAGLHDYMKFLKYGYGRATDQLCLEIRAGRMTREAAIRRVKDYEGKLPCKYLPDFLSFTGISEEEFFKTLDRFTNRKIFLTDKNGNFVRDKFKEVIKIDYGYQSEDRQYSQPEPCAEISKGPA